MSLNVTIPQNYLILLIFFYLFMEIKDKIKVFIINNVFCSTN